MSQTRIILGIDPGFGRLGFGYLEVAPGQTKAIDYGIISTSSETAFEQRLHQIGQDLDTLINQRRPHIIGIEKLYFAKNTKTAMRVAEARGVILFTCAKHNIPVVEFTPAQIKKSLTGDGTADKKAIQWMVKEILNLKAAPRIDDAADALAVALTVSSIKW
ncbi:crossover junction endodeoxyribonuclease RuvC [Patescibacteria group bacterium]|nr:crossover junction endodeoxyribonuclease RuvC [Patescibacteria group bacterium]MBU1705220.1 crossover junction endodeoxyribonuclease RuvC [Patescibacteria group bacterium]